ncbi:hypothetical protein STFR1_30003 [Bacillus vallismortis]
MPANSDKRKDVFFNHVGYDGSFAEEHLKRVHPPESNKWMFLLFAI